jgi:hypothetical protein
MNDDPSYHEVDALTLGEHWRVASDTERIAFGRRDGEVTLFEADGRETVSVPGPLEDFDLDRYLLTLSDDEVSAYTVSEVELWTQTVPDATDVVGLGGKDVLTVLTGDGQVVGLDLETGGTLFEVSRPHDDFTEIHLAGGGGRLCIGAWSFVTCLDARGNVVFDRNLDSTVEDVGHLDDLVLVTLKDGSVVALDAATGNQQWSNSASLRCLSPRGRERVPALTESGAVLVHTEGRMTPLAVETGQQVVSADDGCVLGVTDDTSVQIYRLGPPPSSQLKGEILTGQIAAETPIRASIANTGESSIEPTLELDTSQPLDLDSRFTQLALAAGESREIAYRVGDLPSTSPFECALVVGDTELASRSIAVNRQVALTESVTVDVVRKQVVGGTIAVVCTVENTSDTTLDTVRIGDETVGTIEPGESIAVEREYPLDGRDRTITVEITNQNSVETVERQVTVPERAIQVEITRVDGETPCVDVVVQPAAPIRVRGDLTVEFPAGVSLTRELELDEEERHTLAVVLPPSVAARDEVPMRVDSLLLAEEREARLAGWDESRPHQGARSSPSASRAGTNGPEAERDIDSRQEASPNRQATGAGRDSGRAEQTARDRPEERLQVERKLPQQVKRGARFTEQLQVTNESSRPLTDVTVSDSLGRVHIDQLDGTSRVTLQRYHALFESGDHRLGPVEVEGTRSSSHEIQVVDPDIRVEAAAVRTGSEGAVTFEITNDSERRCTVVRTGIDISPTDGGEVWDFDDSVAVEPGATETVTRNLEMPARLDRVTRQVLVEYRQDGSRHRRRTLAPLTDTEASTDGAAVEVQLLEKSRLVADTQGVIEVAVENDGNVPMRDVTIAVEGDIVLQTALSQDSKTVAELAPGGRETLLVDVMPEHSGQESFEIVVEGTVDEESVTDRLTFEGPVADTGEMWEQNALLEEWTKEGDNGGVRIESSHLATQFRPTEGESHR